MKFYSVLVLVLIVATSSLHADDAIPFQDATQLKLDAIRSCELILKQTQMVLFRIQLSRGIGSGIDRTPLFRKAFKVRSLIGKLKMTLEEPEILVNGEELLREGCELKELNREFTGKIQDAIRSLWPF